MAKRVINKSKKDEEIKQEIPEKRKSRGGRPKVNRSLGDKKIRSFSVYDYEYIKLKQYYAMLKRERSKYDIDVEENTDEQTNNNENL